MKKIHQNGFTLIELMAAVAIMVIIAGVGFFSVSNFTQTQGVQDDGKALAGEFRRVYSMATGVSYPSAACTSLSGYSVSGNSGGNTLTVTALCNSGNVVDTRNEVIKTSVFKNNFSFTFEVNTGNVPSGTVVTIQDINNSGITNDVSVFNNGVVKTN